MTLKEQKGANMENDNIIISDEALDNFLEFTEQIYSIALSSEGYALYLKKDRKQKGN